MRLLSIYSLLPTYALQIVCLTALTQTEPIVGDLDEATSGSTQYLGATIYITAWQALAGVAKVRGANTATVTNDRCVPQPLLKTAYVPAPYSAARALWLGSGGGACAFILRNERYPRYCTFSKSARVQSRALRMHFIHMI